MRSSTFARLAVVALIAAFLPALPVSSSSAAAANTGTSISYTLEGCRASTEAYLPGTFVCPTSAYTTGNLGKGWNEFDLVPGRVTVGAGNQHPSGESFSFVVAVDNCSTGDGATTCSGFPGYDRLSTLTLNNDLSSGTCGSATVSGPAYAAPGIGGTGTSLYRTVTVAGQTPGSTCVYDFYARLAFNSHLFPGASLHFDLANSALGTSGIGARDVSIPVKEILAPGFTKSQRSTQGSDVVWTVGKNSTPATVSFSQTCPPTADPQSHAVTVVVTWTKTTTASGAVTVTATIQLQNNAHRTIDGSVSDQLYSGATPASGNEVQAAKVTAFSLDANASQTITDIWSVTGSTATAFSDIATATFHDPVFDETLGTATRTASSSVETLAATSGASAVISDVETLTDTATPPAQLTTASPFRFSVDSVSGVAGSFSDYPVLGAQTVGPVTWSSGSVSDSGSTTFNKTVYVNSPTTDSARLSDTATVSPADQSSSSASASSTITGGATVSVAIHKTMNLTFTSAKTFTFHFSHVVSGSTVQDGSTSVTIPAGSSSGDATMSPLDPGVTYAIHEDATAPYGTQDTTAVVNLPSCSLTKNITNIATPANARVQKITNPTGSTSWSFTLTGPNSLSETVSATAGAGYVPFTSLLDQDGGTYTITEVPTAAQSTWDLTSIAGDLSGNTARVSRSIASKTCSFTLNLSTDSGTTLSCTFTNTQESRVRVLKTENGGVPTHAYTFTLAGGPDNVSLSRTTSSVNGGVLDFGYQKPGSYTLCELAVPAATTSTLQTTYGGHLDPNTGNICLDFTLAAGSDTDFTIDNRTPGGGQRTIGYWKHWNSYTLGLPAGTCTSSRTGNTLMDCLLPQPLGNYVVNTAAKGVAVLSNPSSKYAENQLAAQLLAAELNKAAGASICASVNTAITRANAMLADIGYAGPPSAVVGSSWHDATYTRADFVSTASLLNNYNNALVC